MKSDKIKITKKYDKRIKLTNAEREEIKELKLSINEIARMYGVSKRLVQFIKYPERLERCKEMRALRGGSKIYYDREYNTNAKRKHRAYKKELLDSGKLTPPPSKNKTTPSV